MRFRDGWGEELPSQGRIKEAFIMSLRKPFVLAVLPLLAACSGKTLDIGTNSAGTDTSPPTGLSHGLKIFVTSRTHNGDFVDDPTLNGATVVAKADDFCNSDANKPDSATYKALLVDGVTRDAKPEKDWVLEPTTTYYRPYNDVEIGTTSPNAIFVAEYVPLKNPVSATFIAYGAWTGIGNVIDFSTQDTCRGWSTLEAVGALGSTTHTNGSAFASPTGLTCWIYAPLYCVEQP
jgi:hypothetical protein